MKKIFALLFVAALFAMSCDKEESTENSGNSNNSNNFTDPSDTTQNNLFIAEVIPEAVTDYDGNSYDAVRFAVRGGVQIWMASNLRTTHYANGDEIPVGRECSAEPRLYATSNSTYAYGYLYNWYAVMHGADPSTANPSGVQGICPYGWHVPSAAECAQLIAYCTNHIECMCGGDNQNIAKSLAADYDWDGATDECAPGYDQSTNNITGFNVLPAGKFTTGGIYCNAHMETGFWTTSVVEEASRGIHMSFTHYSPIVDLGDSDWSWGYSVRCVKD